MKKWLASYLRQLVRRRNGQGKSRVISGHEISEEIRIDSLIYPLRYDVIVRAEFMAYYRQCREVYVHDFESFLTHPVAQAYLTAWSSDASRSRPQLGLDQVALQREFRFRVRRAVALHESLESSGFDERHPIELRSAARIRHEHDKHVQRRFYAGDGCHRLAFLAAKGHTNLTPGQYCVREFDEFQPRDNTYLLLGTVIRTAEDYCRAMSKYYSNGIQYSEARAILKHVQQRTPNQVDEVASVMRVDLRRLSQLGSDTEVASLDVAASIRVTKD